jgi:hypothetical protein
MKFTTEYVSCSTSEVTLPVPWCEIKRWYIKWHTLFFSLDGKNYQEITLDCGEVDYKRPTAISVTDEDGSVLYDSREKIDTLQLETALAQVHTEKHIIREAYANLEQLVSARGLGQLRLMPFIRMVQI